MSIIDPEFALGDQFLDSGSRQGKILSLEETIKTFALIGF